ncbi:MAG: hypothetical protein DU489_14610 [Nitrosomonas sp.]
MIAITIRNNSCVFMVCVYPSAYIAFFCLFRLSNKCLDLAQTLLLILQVNESVTLPVSRSSVEFRNLLITEISMKKSRFAESRMVAVLKEGEAGMPVAELCCKHGVSNVTCYQWKSKYQAYRYPSYSNYMSWMLRMSSSMHVCRSGAGRCSDQGRSKPKVLTLLARREVIEQLVQTRLSIMRACQIAGSTLATAGAGQRPELLPGTGFHA